MFALIQWQETNEISVLPIHEIKIKGAVSKAKWGSSWHPATILKKSENQEWLESLDVTLDGEIITPKRRSSISSDLLLKKFGYKKRNKQQRKAVQEVVEERNEEILTSKSIFQKSDFESEDEKNEGQKNMEDIDEDYEEPNRSFEVPRSYSDVEEELNNAHEHQQGKNVSNVNKQDVSKNKKQCFCDYFPSVSKAEIQKLRQILELATTIHNLQNLNESETKENSIPKYLTDINRDNTIELVKGTGIMVNSWKLQNIQNCYLKNPREMVRRLMKLILGEDQLRKSSPTGKNGWTPIPENIYEGVQAFVNLNAPKKKYEISGIKYREVLTALCATLRNAKKERSQPKIKETYNENEEKANDELLSENIEDKEKKREDKELKNSKKISSGGVLRNMKEKSKPKMKEICNEDKENSNDEILSDEGLTENIGGKERKEHDKELKISKKVSSGGVLKNMKEKSKPKMKEICNEDKENSNDEILSDEGLTENIGGKERKEHDKELKSSRKRLLQGEYRKIKKMKIK